MRIVRLANFVAPHSGGLRTSLAADVERIQLPAAIGLRPDVASVVVGINDTPR